ncbi:putative DEAD-box ATP-dependent RNA helicase [Monocercomonoides exilis]|uniref:putative DEAD-box ATP-dependent RNA helicase n=1 Tax=Monocercomonoides exilis TaxID=2049356 RepID=UPI003559F9F9|nr:putative DEAD-box ATP-dependent RNA helicase [Monocercomonoides exilis]|eukprot:MONOS_10164.1-p1 / transcript=MONOS_10164.1 / gene=MONOS_10164 / organism=Monocercomonoides_exilis_PA203 / gene_product=DEAD-box ATP-dependent RNA helicase / transcript_product=DEAD-box ATP-dependent RNA helicase / location=Mono_scaffold00450:33562-35649(-) / protein_length=575 / sequence_SO=supercontig / SO=protein_coding / is_pseudo=false
MSQIPSREKVAHRAFYRLLGRNKDEEDELAKRPRTLMEEKAALIQEREEAGPIDEEEEAMKEEAEILRELRVAVKPIISAKEWAEGVVYTEPMPSTWKPPQFLLDMSEEDREKIRRKFNIIADGSNLPPPVLRFIDFKLPHPFLTVLKKRGIKKPTPIQMQALSAGLSGRDLIGIAYTGSGKTLVFIVPALIQALEEEMRLPLVGGEGPFALVLCPSRELARQTFEFAEEFTSTLVEEGYPELRCVLCIGQIDMREQLQKARRGFHLVVATPGRLLEMLKKNRINLEMCKYVCLDEADRMLDQTFEEDVRNIFTFFKGQRQTLLFSATMPTKVQSFAAEWLVKPIIVNTGRAGAANMDVIQEVELVKQEAKTVYLLECLQKTAPPVLIFCENKADVDTIHEYLLLKGVLATAIHGDMNQEDRDAAIKAFKSGKKDVLVATDIASKGLDFPDIQHVINYDMPHDIENYIHRIGRTGRSNKTGVATTFINKTCSDSVLLDLKHLLIEAKQTVPPVLLSIPDPNEHRVAKDGSVGCAFCGGLGHRVANCPKLEKQTLQNMPTQSEKETFSAASGKEW